MMDAMNDVGGNGGVGSALHLLRIIKPARFRKRVLSATFQIQRCSTRSCPARNRLHGAEAASTGG